MNIDKIVFYYPSKITGGAEYLFLRCADYLAEHQDKYAIYIVDYEDGFLRKNASSKRISFIEYQTDTKTQIPDGAAVIVQLNILPLRSKRFVYDSTKSLFVFWCLHTLNIKNYIGRRNHFVLSKSDRKELGEHIRLLTEQNIIKFMGFGAYAIVMRDLFQEPRQFEWLQNIIPIESTDPEPQYQRVSSDELKFCWLGRLDAEKARNIETYMNELESLNSQFRLSLSIIGLGPKEEYLREKASHYSYPIHFVGEKRDENLDLFIRHETEIGLASGTSAMEFSKRGKPTVCEGVIDKIYEAGERKKYYLVSEGQSMYNISTKELYREGDSSFTEKILQILKDYPACCKTEYQYVLQYAPSNCANRLMSIVKDLCLSDQQLIGKHLEVADRLLNRGNRRINIMKKVKSLFSIS